MSTFSPLQVGVVCAAWWHLRKLSQQSNKQFMHPHCIAYCTNSRLGRWQFWHAFQKLLLSSHPWPNTNGPCIPYGRNINMLSSTDNNVMILLFVFKRSRIESWFPFFKLTMYIVLVSGTNQDLSFHQNFFVEIWRDVFPNDHRWPPKGNKTHLWNHSCK